MMRKKFMLALPSLSAWWATGTGWNFCGDRMLLKGPITKPKLHEFIISVIVYYKFKIVTIFEMLQRKFNVLESKQPCVFIYTGMHSM